MKRRDFAIGLALVPVATTFALAAADLTEGKDYVVLSTPQPLAVAGKLEVIEFFGYWCPHCSAFEPRLDAWIKTLAADVNFRRIPVAWQDPHIPYQKLYYALEALGVGSAVHPKVFKAFHELHLRLDSDAAIAAFATGIGVDKGKLADAMNSFSVASKIQLASQQTKNYQIEGVPTLVVNGKYLTSPELAAGEVQSLRVVDALLQKARSQH
jgi:thiol:disulfide interchange protein DsbA